MRPSESDSCFQQTRFEVLLDALLAVKAGRIGHNILAPAKNLRGNLEVVFAEIHIIGERVDLRPLRGASFPPGLYLLRLEQDGHTARSRMVVLQP